MKLGAMVLIVSCIIDILGPIALLIKNRVTIKDVKKVPGAAIKAFISIILNALALMVFIDYISRI